MPVSHLIRGYRNLPGKHCGSTAMRNLLHHYCGLELTEEETFGLGSGLDFILIETKEFEPGVLLFGRGAILERDAAAALGIDYREQTHADDDEAWEQVRAEVLRDRPTLLSGDIFYLDYRNYTVHFPGHRFVLLGFDDAKHTAFVADRIDPEPQPCSYEALRASRNPPSSISTHNLWGGFFDTRVGRSFEEACGIALERCASRMLEPGREEGRLGGGLEGGGATDVSLGLRGLQVLRERLPGWPERHDGRLVASYASQCIEKFGTGGGNFRGMYAEFLRRARGWVPGRVTDRAPDLMAESAKCWTELSIHLRALSENPAETGPLLRRCDRALAQILELETRVFESIAARG